ncbi:hypothetical protein Pla52n_06060 [Stieleria varia]|uniref:Uncharacterized protein n=1 Tax=Stieleria varia TaxID=2528005 RepID=A0A5C6B7U2_9BACT|nr:hypothetical protein Pla52n_06060 [Stieleria varia]
MASLYFANSGVQSLDCSKCGVDTSFDATVLFPVSPPPNSLVEVTAESAQTQNATTPNFEQRKPEGTPQNLERRSLQRQRHGAGNGERLGVLHVSDQLGIRPHQLLGQFDRHAAAARFVQFHHLKMPNHVGVP